MSVSPLRLPDHPSLENLRKQAKGLLRNYRGGVPAAVDRIRAVCPTRDPVSLADAQFVLAREYGFESWLRLVHHVAAFQPSPLRPFAELADDIVAACTADDAEALGRVNRLFGRSLDRDRLRTRVSDRLT